MSFVPQANVYVCGNGTTKVYHKIEDCPRLKQCSYETLKMSDSKAINKGLRECRDKSD